MTDQDLEKLEKRYLDYIVTSLRQDLRSFINGLNSRLPLIDDWKKAFMRTAAGKGKKKPSDLNAGAERIFHHLFTPMFRFPNSCPIGSDLMYMTEDCIIHIEVKTILNTNTDYKGKVQLGRNQISYNIKGERFKPNLPQYYKSVNLPTLTYAIQIVHQHMSGTINAFSVICIPNGQLQKHYGKEVLQAGKGGWEKASDIRYKYSEEPTFKLLSSATSKIYRIEVLALNNSFTIKELTGLDEPIIPYRKL